MGWCISDSENSEIIEIFLGQVKARSPDTNVKVIMTDDGMLLLCCVRDLNSHDLLL